MMNKLFIICTIFLFLLPVVFAATDYNMTGNENTDYKLGTGDFNSAKQFPEDVTVSTASFSDTKQTPLVSDLDGDGTNEIIVLDEDTFFLMQTSNLNVVGTFDMGNEERYSNFITFDVDGDGNREIIVARETTKDVVILEWNGTSLNNQTTFSFTSVASSHADGELMIGCGETDKCLLSAITHDDTFTSSTVSIQMGGFTSTGMTTDGTQILNTHTSGAFEGTFCYPKIRTMTYGNCDSDGDLEFAFSYAHITESGGGDEEVRIACVSTNASGFASIDQHIDNGNLESSVFEDVTGASSCSATNYGRFFTSPLVADISSSPNNEKIVALNKNALEFKIQSFEDDGSHLNDYPAIADGEGVLVSNVALATADEDSPSNKEFCVMGFQGTTGGIDIICGSELGGTPRSRSFNSDAPFNITEDYLRYDNVIHSVQNSNEQVSGFDPSEFVSAFGVVKLDYSSSFCSLLGNCESEIIFTNPKGSSVVIQSNVENIGISGNDAAEDLLIMTDSNLFYFDDQISNQPAEVTSVNFNPCIVDSTLKLNTTLRITTVVTDGNSDLLGQDDVSHEVKVYEGLSNEQFQNASNVTSGSERAFFFVMNQTGVSNQITIEGFDTAFPEIKDLQTQTFTVGTNGLEFGDSECDISFVAADNLSGQFSDEVAAALAGDPNDNVGINLATTLTSITGLPGAAAWLLFMLLINGLAIAAHYFPANPLSGGTMRDRSIDSILMIVVAGDIGWIIFGTLIGVLSIGLTITMGVLFAVPIAYYIRSHFTRNPGMNM